MTYTTVYKDYEAKTLADAAAAMLRDSEVFAQETFERGPRYVREAGMQQGVLVESWDWDGKRLRVNFR